MRSKEDAHDYRYFPDPDLLPLDIDEAWLAEVRAAMPELPAAKCARFTQAYGLSAYDAMLLTAAREVSDYFEAMVEAAPPQTAKLCANWITGALTARLNDEGLDISASKVAARSLRALVDRVADGTLSGKMAKEVFDAMWTGEGEADAIIDRRGLRQISDSGAIEKVVDEVLAANAAQVADYRSGKQKAFNSLVGQVMKATKGKANPQQVNEALRRRLDGQA